VVTTLYTLHDAAFAYPGRPPSVAGITIGIERGDHAALVGMNGAGKSTLLHMLAGLLYPTSGQVLFEGMPLTHEHIEHDAEFRKSFRSRVGILFQNSDTQLFCPTVREEVAFGPLQLWRRDEAMGRVDAMLDRLEIARLAGEAPYALSGGEKRRVALASVLVMEPEVLLLDEPATNLDPRTCDFLFDILDEVVADPDRTVITATHDLEVARELAPRCIILSPEHGVAADGQADRVLADEALLRGVNLIGSRGGTGGRRGG
jgi:cobalt/nickel transport system ATP-binding protein